MKYVLLLCCLAVLVSGCQVGGEIHSTMRYNEIQETIAKNNDNLLRVKMGMPQEEVIKIMAKPERSEGYAWGSAWLYRTAMTSGVYGTSDSDFTPVVFGQNGKVIGWGRNFFVDHAKKYDINIKNK